MADIEITGPKEVGTIKVNGPTESGIGSFLKMLGNIVVDNGKLLLRDNRDISTALDTFANYKQRIEKMAVEMQKIQAYPENVKNEKTLSVLKNRVLAEKSVKTNCESWVEVEQNVVNALAQLRAIDKRQNGQVIALLAKNISPNSDISPAVQSFTFKPFFTSKSFSCIAAKKQADKIIKLYTPRIDALTPKTKATTKK